MMEQERFKTIKRSFAIVSAIPDMCYFWYTSIFLKPVQSTLKKCKNSGQQKALRENSVTKYFGIYFVKPTWCFFG